MFRNVYASSLVGVFRDDNVTVLYEPDPQKLTVIPRNHSFEDYVSGIKSSVDVRKPHPTPRNLMLRLLITSRCNLNCAYCQMKKLTGGRYQDMSRNVIDDILLHAANENYDYVTIHFSGGEPLIAANRIDYVCREVKRLGIRNVRFAVSTNGTLLDREENLSVLAENHIHTIVSIDGLGEANGKRLDYSRRDSTESVLRACRKAADAGLSLGMSTVFIKENAGHAIELVDYLFREYRIRSLGFNYQHYSGFGKDNIDTDGNYMKEYTRMLIAVSDFCREHDIFEEQSNRLIEPFVFSRKRTRHCTSQSSQITVMPDGNVSPCKTFASAQKDTARHSDWLSGDFSGILNKWRNRSTATIEKCDKCLYRNICGGGCPYEAYVDFGDIMHPDSRYCSVPRDFFTAMLDTLKAKGVFDPVDSPRIITEEEKKCLLTCKDPDLYGVTTSVGHILEQ